ncbi:MAG: GxxExxY protein [Ignavibacteria bacterium]
MNNDLLHKEITDKILKCFYEVYTKLGYGFLERIYKNAMHYELNSSGIMCESEKQIKVFYKGNLMGDYYSDLIVDNKVIVELKTCESLREEHEWQLINYLRSTDIEVGLLLNFGKKPEFKRKLFTNNLKKIKDQ